MTRFEGKKKINIIKDMKVYIKMHEKSKKKCKYVTICTGVVKIKE